MAKRLGNEETVTMEELVVSHAYEMMALVTLLDKKGIISKAEMLEEIRSLKKQ